TVDTTKLSDFASTHYVDVLNADQIDGYHVNDILNLDYNADAGLLTGVMDPSRLPAITGGIAATRTNATTIDMTVEGIQGRSISTTAPDASNRMLIWDGSAWTPDSLNFSDDFISGTPNTVVKIQGRDVTNTAPGANQVLGWNGSAWAPMSLGVTGSATVVEYTGTVNFLATDTNITTANCSANEI